MPFIESDFCSRRASPRPSGDSLNERIAKDSSDFRPGEQAEHRLGHRAETAPSRLAVGDYLSERTAGAGSQGPDCGFAGRVRLYVRRLLGRANRKAFQCTNAAI